MPMSPHELSKVKRIVYIDRRVVENIDVIVVVAFFRVLFAATATATKIIKKVRNR